MVGWWRGAAFGAGTAAVLLLGACGRNATFSYASPDGAVVLVIEPQGESGPRSGRRNDVYFEGEDESATASAWPEKVPVGSFVGVWGPASVAWIDATTVNICPLAKSVDVVRSARVAVTEAGAQRAYRVTTDCGRVRRAAPLTPYPSEVDERPAG